MFFKPGDLVRWFAEEYPYALTDHRRLVATVVSEREVGTMELAFSRQFVKLLWSDGTLLEHDSHFIVPVDFVLRKLRSQQ